LARDGDTRVIDTLCTLRAELSSSTAGQYTEVVQALLTCSTVEVIEALLYEHAHPIEATCPNRTVHLITTERGRETATLYALLTLKALLITTTERRDTALLLTDLSERAVTILATG